MNETDPTSPMKNVQLRDFNTQGAEPQPTGQQPTGPQPTGPQQTGVQPTGPQQTGPQPTGPQPTGPQPVGNPFNQGPPGQPGPFMPQGRTVNFQPPGPGGPQFRPGPGGQMIQPNLLQGGPFPPGQGMPGQFGGPGQPGQFRPMGPGGPGQPGMPGQPPMGYPGGPRPNNTGLNSNMAQPLLSNNAPGSRFADDNRGLQNVQSNNDAGAFGATQTMCGECQGWLATYLPCCCCCFPNPYEIVAEGFTGIIMRFGRFHKLVGPGQHFLNRDVDSLILVDKRERVVELKRQAVVSKDNTSFGIDAVVYFRVENSYKSKFGVRDLRLAIEDLAITTLRNVIGRYTLQEFLQKRDEVAEDVEVHVREPAENWGAKVLRVLVQDVMLPPEARSLFSTGALTKKIAEAQIIQSKADVESARLMKEAADALNTEAALQIRYVDALENVARSNNPKLIFFPADYRDVGTVNDHVDDESIRLMK